VNDEEEESGSRESPMARNGGLASDEGSPFIPVPQKGHPPIDCPNPRVIPSALGYYPCPCCGRKARHISHVSGRETGYEIADTIGSAITDGIKWAWEIAWPTIQTLIEWAARAIKWAILHAIPVRQEDNREAIQAADAAEHDQRRTLAQNPEGSQ
jgi:hypothetical protein